MQKLFVVATMDCERPRSETYELASGPPDYRASEESVRGYARIARSFGLPVTFFIHPETAIAQSRLYEELETEGDCIGLHLHPWRFGDGRYKAELGGLSENESRAVISEATALWTHAFGRRPLYFRPGAMSANDTTFRVLAELGFRGGSLSLPGRVFPDIHAVWAGACPDPHRAHPVFRQLAGDLPFVNMPVSVDFSRINEKKGRWFHWDLRPDFDGIDFDQTVRNILGQTMARNPNVPVVNILTHNDSDYTDSGHPNTRNFVATLESIVAASRELGLEPVGATIEKICDLVLSEPAPERSLNRKSGKVMFEDGPLRTVELA